MYTSIPELHNLFLSSSGVEIDSRSVKSGSVFFALKGEKTDGNLYARQALEKGALACVVDDHSLKDVRGCYLVQDVLQALQHVAAFHRDTFQFPVIGLTGSNGKTTSKELLAAVLSTEYKVTATKGNLNNHIGVPLTLLSVKEPLDFLIVEMGANHQGEIQFLCEIAKPDYGYITNIGKAHLEGFGGEEGVKKGKSELYRFINSRKGKLFVNAEDPILLSLLPALPLPNIIYYHPSAFFAPSDDMYIQFSLDGKTWPTHLVGEYNLANIAAAISAGQYFGIKPDHIGDAIQNYEPTNNRSQQFFYRGNSLIMDAYNANPSSMKVSIDNFGKLSADKKIIILGDMFELGEYTDSEHTALIEFTKKYTWQKAVFIGKYFKTVQQNIPDYLFFETVEEAEPFFKSLDNTGSTVLLKGSRGIALEQLLEK